MLPHLSRSKAMDVSVCLSNIFQITFGGIGAHKGSRTDLIGLYCSRVCFPREREMHSQTPSDLTIGGRA